MTANTMDIVLCHQEKWDKQRQRAGTCMLVLDQTPQMNAAYFLFSHWLLSLFFYTIQGHTPKGGPTPCAIGPPTSVTNLEIDYKLAHRPMLGTLILN